VLQVVYMAQTRQVKRLEGLRLIARFWDSRRRVQDGRLSASGARCVATVLRVQLRIRYPA